MAGIASSSPMKNDSKFGIDIFFAKHARYKI
jgi:hypothetical protein